MFVLFVPFVTSSMQRSSDIIYKQIVQQVMAKLKKNRSPNITKFLYVIVEKSLLFELVKKLS